MTFKHYYKIVENGIITSLHGSNSLPAGAVEMANKEAYDALVKYIGSEKPEDTLEHVYKLSADTEKYVAFERTEEEIIQWYQEKVNSGMALEEVPAEYQEKIVVAAEPISEYQQGYDDAVAAMVEAGIL